MRMNLLLKRNENRSYLRSGYASSNVYMMVSVTYMGLLSTKTKAIKKTLFEVQ